MNGFTVKVTEYARLVRLTAAYALAIFKSNLPI
jgi:hypothetical protein